MQLIIASLISVLNLVKISFKQLCNFHDHCVTNRAMSKKHIMQVILDKDHNTTFC